MEPKNLKLSLLDADVVAYRCAFAATNYSESVAIQKVDELVQWVIDETVGFQTETNFQGFLTGKGNFRYTYNSEYKANRKGATKPDHLPITRQRLIDRWGCVVTEGKEADDALATAVTTHGNPENVVIVSVDKDMKTVPCWHFNLTRGDWFYSDEDYAKNFFYQQILMGDTADNIVGMRGVGPKKAEKFLEDLTDEAEMYSVCFEAYSDYYQKLGETLDTSLELSEQKILENGRLLHLQRYEGQIWEPKT